MKLPKVNDLGFFEIRLESIGGMGANSAGKMLADVGVLSQGYNGAAFSSYGSEKKGSPVKSFVRFADSETSVRVNSTVEEPHIVAVFHMNLLKNPMTLMGVKDDAIVIFNTNMSPKEARDFAKLHGGKVVCVDAIKIAGDLHLPSQAANTIIMGAMIKQLPFIEKELFEKQIRKQFDGKKPELVEPNIEAFRRGYDDSVEELFAPEDKYPYIPYKKPEPVYGKNNQLTGGYISAAGNSTLKDLQVTRTGKIPVFNPANCIDCAQCEAVCPDLCIVWERGPDRKKPEVTAMNMMGIDYQYCKGCLKCVRACPKGPYAPKPLEKDQQALRIELEVNFDVDKLTYSRYKKNK